MPLAQIVYIIIIFPFPVIYVESTYIAHIHTLYID
jgi:hypothetical protein